MIVLKAKEIPKIIKNGSFIGKYIHVYNIN